MTLPTTTAPPRTGVWSWSRDGPRGIGVRSGRSLHTLSLCTGGRPGRSVEVPAGGAGAGAEWTRKGTGRPRARLDRLSDAEGGTGLSHADLPVSDLACDPETERLVDRHHGPVAVGVRGPDAAGVGALVEEMPDHRSLEPLS